MLWIARSQEEADQIIEKASQYRCTRGVRHSNIPGRPECWIVTITGLIEKLELIVLGKLHWNV